MEPSLGEDAENRYEDHSEKQVCHVLIWMGIVSLICDCAFPVVVAMVQTAVHERKNGMSIKPVDVFMTGDSDGNGCPIGVAAIFGAMMMGAFQEIDEPDLHQRSDIIYTGFVGEVGDVLVILDAGPDSIIATVDDDDGGTWTIELTGEFLAANKA